MKRCIGCKHSLDLSLFSQNKHKRDGLDSYCKLCMKVRSAEHYRKNAEKRRQQTMAWLAANPGKNAEYSLKWRMANPGAQSLCDRAHYVKNRNALLAQDKARRESRIDEFLRRERASYARNKNSAQAKNKRWRERNKPVIAAHAAKRRSAKALRTPPWLTDGHFRAIEKFYQIAAQETERTGLLHHVDHVVPLRGKTVSGLHVPWNLQILLDVDNLSKSNRLWPDAP